MQLYLPAECKVIGEFANLLPSEEFCPANPFSSMVINLNICSDGHRDSMDNKICLVIPFSECEGGELAHYEQGLVIKLKSGCGLIFTSATTTHFNLHFKGKRSSMVFSSDKRAESWIKDRNGWQNNVTFRRRS